IVTKTLEQHPADGETAEPWTHVHPLNFELLIRFDPAEGDHLRAHRPANYPAHERLRLATPPGSSLGSRSRSPIFPGAAVLGAARARARADLVAVRARTAADDVGVSRGRDGDELGAVAIDVEARSARPVPGEAGLLEAVLSVAADGQDDRVDGGRVARGGAGVVGRRERDGVASDGSVLVDYGLPPAAAAVAEIPGVAGDRAVRVDRGAGVETAAQPSTADNEAGSGSRVPHRDRLRPAGRARFAVVDHPQRDAVAAGLAVGVVDRGHARARADGVAEVPLVADDRAVAVTRAAAVEVAGEARAAVREACDRRHVCRGAGYGHSLLADPIYARVVGHVETDGVASCGGVG